MNSRRRGILFMTVVCLAIAWAMTEIFLIIWIIIEDKPDILKGVVASANAFGAAYGLRLVYKAWEKEFIQGQIIVPHALRNCYQARFDTLAGQPHSKELSLKPINQNLMRAYLRLLEHILIRKVGRFDYEISVFWNSETPEIVSYHDSGGRTMPSSCAERRSNPYYYIEQKYAVVELLKRPTSEFIVIEDTTKTQSGYEFKNSRQKEKIKSTVLHCISPEMRSAIVITCNQKGAFSEDDETLKEIVRGIGSALICDFQLATHCFLGECELQ